MNYGRPLEFDPNQALQEAMEVYWRKGYEAASLQDLLTAMGIAKSSFYQTFGSKRELFQRCLVAFRERQVQRMTTALERSPSGMAFLRSALRNTADEAEATGTPKGCLIMNTATEFAGRDAAIAELVSDGTRQFAGIFRAAIARAQTEGDIAPERNAQVLSEFLVTTMSGLRTMVKAGMAPAAITAVADVALGAL